MTEWAVCQGDFIFIHPLHYPPLTSESQPNMTLTVTSVNYCSLNVCPSSLRVDYERIKSIGPDRAAAEWLLRCGAKVRFQGFDRWHHDYNGLPTGPLDRYKIQAIDATESCIMHRGFDHLGQWRCSVMSESCCSFSVTQILTGSSKTRNQTNVELITESTEKTVDTH